MSAAVGLDPILTEILWNRLVSIADEQARALFRGSFSTAVGESEDFASTVHDAQGRMIAQSVSTGTISMLTGLTKSIQMIAARFADELAPGDAIVCNDPWLFSGHKFDVTVASPVFRGARLVAWTVTCLHVADVGGGGFSASDRRAYEEGMNLPPKRLYRAGVPNDELFALIEANVRMPQEVLGDLQAQAAANDVGGAKLLELLDEYGLDDLVSLSETIIERSEQALRAAVERLPDGVYVHEVQMDGRGDELLAIRAAVTVDGSEIAVDFAGSSPQVDYGVNGTLNVAYGWAAHAIKSALVPSLPNNEGFFRPISVDAPAGSIVNARFPAPTSGRHMLFMYLSGAVFGALAQVVPETVVADSGIITIPSLHGRAADGSEFAYWFMTNNGMGATSAADGYSGTSCPASVPTPSVEIMESVSPVFIERREFVTDSGGPGRLRGGLAQEIVFSVRVPERALLSCMFERVHSPAQGTRGGGAGARGYVLLNGEPIDAKGQVWLRPGDRVAVSGGGGGGYGSCAERDPDAVRRDVADGLVTPASARAVYGIGEEETE